MSFLSHQDFNNLTPINHQDTRTIAFVDGRLLNCETIAQQVISTARVIIIGSEDDGIEAICQVLGNSNCSEIHIFASGSPGCINLGNKELSLGTIKSYSSKLNCWFNVNDSIELPFLGIYGFNLAMGDVGEEFLTKLSQITGAKIAASINVLESSVLTSS